MSVCFFMTADQAGTSASVEEGEAESLAEEVQVSPEETAQQNLMQFWAKVTEDIKGITGEDFKTQALPLARIKKIMKLDEDVKMISAEAPVLFAKAAEIFIHELTLRAWHHTQDNKRRTLQRNDVAMAISKSDQFDFLIDIVPRSEAKPSKPREEMPHTVSSTDQLQVQQQQVSLQGSAQQLVLPCAQVMQSQPQAAPAQTVVNAQQPVTLVQQVVSPTGEVQSLPIQLTQTQVNMIRLQMQNNPTQPIIIQTQAQPPPAQGPQIIQVSSQAPHHQQQIYLAQVAPSQEES